MRGKKVALFLRDNRLRRRAKFHLRDGEVSSFVVHTHFDIYLGDAVSHARKELRKQYAGTRHDDEALDAILSPIDSSS